MQMQSRSCIHGVPGVWCSYNNTIRLLRRSSRLILIDIVVDSEDDFFTGRDPVWVSVILCGHCNPTPQLHRDVTGQVTGVSVFVYGYSYTAH